MIGILSSSKINKLLASLPLSTYLYYIFAGFLLTLSFSPFHVSATAILSLALLFYGLMNKKPKGIFLSGLSFGLGFFSSSISWVYISIYDYGHLSGFIATIITLTFILYLSLFPGLATFVFKQTCFKQERLLANSLLFSALWVISEWLRAICLSGFPWVLTGVGQINSPARFLLPIIGIYGVSFYTALSASIIASSVIATKRLPYVIGFLFLILCPLLFKNIQWTSREPKALSVGVVQANLSMKDKWDEALFWQLLERYSQGIEKLLGADLIVLPESAFPLPKGYITEFINTLDLKAKKKGSALLIGMPEAVKRHSDLYFNSLVTLGKAQGVYHNQHLVPFGEYVPSILNKITQWIELPDMTLLPDMVKQQAIKVHNHPVATLICYELAYSELLRKQLPFAEWIVSISDDGWFGKSLAIYQQLQLAQVLSLQSGRYQIVANNDGLSSLIDSSGNILAYLPVFTEGLVKGEIYPVTGQTPWIKFGDNPALLFSLFIIIVSLLKQLFFKKEMLKSIAAGLKRRYPYQPS